ncbi:hypothetical protein HZS_4667 [Henneguya salminicola]|nr:hypothetical protein HZS_4667 [Henneguya salminicola]
MIAIISGTLYLIILLYQHKKMRLSTNILCCNLFISDTCGVAIPATLRFYGAFCHNYTFKDCQVVISLTKIFGYISILSLLWICIDRYIKIVAYFTYKKYYSIKNILLLLTITWLISLIYGTFADMNWSKLLNKNNRDKYSLCRYVDVLPPIYGIVNESLTIILPIFVIMALYILLYFRIKKLSKFKNLTVFQSPQSSGIQKKTKTNIDSILLFTSIAVCFIYIICVLPITIIDIIDDFIIIYDMQNQIYIPVLGC